MANATKQQGRGIQEIGAGLRPYVVRRPMDELDPATKKAIRQRALEELGRGRAALREHAESKAGRATVANVK